MNESDYLFSIEGFKKTDIQHWGIKGQKWGVRRYQNLDGSLTPAGRKRYSNSDGSLNEKGKKKLDTESYNKSKKFGELSKSIPGLKRDGDSIIAKKDGVELTTNSNNVSTKKFAEIYKNLGQHKKDMMTDMEKDIVKQAAEYGIDDYQSLTKNAAGFRIRMMTDSVAEAGYYTNSANVYGEFDISGKKPRLLRSVEIDT